MYFFDEKEGLLNYVEVILETNILCLFEEKKKTEVHVKLTLLKHTVNEKDLVAKETPHHQS